MAPGTPIGRNANKLIDLLDDAESDELDHKHRYRLIHALHRIFLHLWDMRGKKDNEQSEVHKFANWIHEQYLEFVKLLLHLIKSHATELEIAAFKILADFLVQTGQRVPKLENKFPNLLYTRMLQALVLTEHDNHAIISELTDRMLHHDDIRYYTLKALTKYVPHGGHHRAVPPRCATAVCGATDAALWPCRVPLRACPASGRCVPHPSFAPPRTARFGPRAATCCRSLLTSASSPLPFVAGSAPITPRTKPGRAPRTTPRSQATCTVS